MGQRRGVSEAVRTPVERAEAMPARGPVAHWQRAEKRCNVRFWGLVPSLNLTTVTYLLA